MVDSRTCADDARATETPSFVDGVFEAIQKKSYDPSKPAPVTLAPTAQSFLPGAGGQQPQQVAPLGPTRKRSFQDDFSNGQYGQQRGGRGGRGDRPMKQLRRGGRGYDSRGGHMDATNYPPPFPVMPGMDLDPNNPLASLMAMQQMMGMQLPGMPQLPFAGSPGPGSAQPQRSGKRCRDYDNKGFCARGAACPYDHGNDPIIAPSNGEEYDPTNASLGQGENGYSDHGRGGFEGKGRGRGRGRGDRGAFRGGRGARADFSSAGPNHDRSVTSVVVEQIPEEKFNEESVRDFFAEFGNIEEVTMQGYKRLAIVKFDDYFSAKRAYDSPKVIFDNRFVKVYWYKPDTLPKPPGGQHATNGQNAGNEDVEMKEKEQEVVDPVELAKKQAEAQRVHEEKRMKIEAAQAQRQELEEKLKQQAEERSKLLAKLAAKERTKTGTSDQGAAQSNGSSNGTADQEPSQTDTLKAKLAALENEAVSIGINPNDESWQGFPARGRGGYRGRGGWQPRGAWRGRGGFAPRGGSVMRLDNRPKGVAVVFPDGEAMGPEKDEALKQYLLFVSSPLHAGVATIDANLYCAERSYGVGGNHTSC